MLIKKKKKNLKIGSMITLSKQTINAVINNFSALYKRFKFTPIDITKDKQIKWVKINNLKYRVICFESNVLICNKQTL